MRRAAWFRFSGLFTMLFMLHLTLAGEDAACRSAQMAAGASMAGMNMSHSARADANDRHGAPNKQAPAARCCEAMTGCAIAIVSGGVESSSSMARAIKRIAGAGVEAPASPRSGPEPPPPKA
jgi:hypothetical protein